MYIVLQIKPALEDNHNADEIEVDTSALDYSCDSGVDLDSVD